MVLPRKVAVTREMLDFAPLLRAVARMHVGSDNTDLEACRELGFVGCNGVDAHGGITNRNVAEAEIKRAMVRASRRAVVVADASKLGEVEVARVCPVTDIDLLVTDGSADADLVAELGNAGLAVDLVGTT